MPATCAVINGQAKVGLTDSEFLAVADAQSDVMKASRRDLAYAVATKEDCEYNCCRDDGASTCCRHICICYWWVRRGTPRGRALLRCQR